MRRLATGSPRSIRFASATSSAAVSSLCRPTSARKSWSESAAPAGASAAQTSSTTSFSAAGARRDADVEPRRLELARERLGLLVGELVLERERLELGRLDVAALLGALDERLDLLGLEQLAELVLGHVRLGPFMRRRYKPLLTLRRFPVLSRALRRSRRCHKPRTCASHPYIPQPRRSGSLGGARAGTCRIVRRWQDGRS